MSLILAFKTKTRSELRQKTNGTFLKIMDGLVFQNFKILTFWFSLYAYSGGIDMCFSELCINCVIFVQVYTISKSSYCVVVNMFASLLLLCIVFCWH